MFDFFKVVRYYRKELTVMAEESPIQCFLVGAPENQQNASLDELKGLTRTLGLSVAGSISLTRIEPTPAYGLGTGKAQEIVDRAKEVFSDCIIFDWEIDPTKQRNWEKLSGLPVYDRNEVIIRIFAQRAKTKEATLQVDLARLTYSLPRLAHTYGDMARQRGGAFGAKGAGETQLELDRRHIEEKISRIKKELALVEENRRTQRKMREKNKIPTCALVGYTNAGKSSLLNALTGADSFVEDKLFATLDPTTRKLALSEASFALLTDTVGFISRLPHTLIKAFRSTLEEASFSDLLLVTVDASDEHCLEQYSEVQAVLKEIGAHTVPRLILLNKIDLVQNDPARLAFLSAHFPEAIKVSAKSARGFDELLGALTEKLLGAQRTFLIPLEKMDLVSLARKNGTIEKEEWGETAITLTARIPGETDETGKTVGRTLSLLLPYQREVLQ